MRRTYRQTAGLTLAAVVALILAGTALAAHPKRSASYSGSGQLCENNGPQHHFTTCVGSDTFSFHTAANGSRVTRFAGRIGPLYCGGGTPTITAGFITVGTDGSFFYRFQVPNRDARRKVTGSDTVEIRGRFTGQGRTASVFYRLVSHFNGSPSSQDCAAQVSGTARAR